MSKRRSPFLSLPRELRDHIYGYLLTTTFLVKVPRTGEVPSPLQLHRHANLGILNVSRSTHEEAKRVLYRYGHFRFDMFSADSPYLHRTINSTPAIADLHSIILHFDLGGALMQGYTNLEVDEFAPMLLRDFAKLHPGVPRSRCVVEFECRHSLLDLLDSSKTPEDFKDALGQLTGFKTVALKIKHRELEWGMGFGYMIPQYNALNEDLARSLGKGEGGCDGEGYRLVYHPRKW